MQLGPGIVPPADDADDANGACVRCVFGFAFEKRAREVETNGHPWIAVETADGTSDENTWRDLGLHSGA